MVVGQHEWSEKRARERDDAKMRDEPAAKRECSNEKRPDVANEKMESWNSNTNKNERTVTPTQ